MMALVVWVFTGIERPLVSPPESESLRWGFGGQAIGSTHRNTARCERCACPVRAVAPRSHAPDVSTERPELMVYEVQRATS